MVMRDPHTRRSRGFGFVNFLSARRENVRRTLRNSLDFLPHVTSYTRGLDGKWLRTEANLVRGRCGHTLRLDN